MSDDALLAEVRQLRDQVARLERERAKPGRASDMDGFRQLNDAIVSGRVQEFARNLQPRWQRNLIIAVILVGWFLIFLSWGVHY